MFKFIAVVKSLQSQELIKDVPKNIVMGVEKSDTKLDPSVAVSESNSQRFNHVALNDL